MTNLKEMTMPDAEHNGGANLKNLVFSSLAMIVILFCIGVIVGVFAAHIDHGGGAMSGKAIGIIVGALAALIAIGVFGFRSAKGLIKGDPDLSHREKLNRVIMWACGGLGAVIGIFLMWLEPTGIDGFAVFSNKSVPATAALSLAALWGVLMPVVAYFWHKKAIDEQEAAAYRDGAYYAAYAYIIGAPTWWILARGGLAPQIDGVAIFLMFNFIWLGVWFYKKYL